MIRWAQSSLEQLRKHEDYSCTFVKRERVHGKVEGPEYLFMKFRRKPFSVYLRTLAPKAGQEIIYVAGRRDGKLLAHAAGSRNRLIGTLELNPDGGRAMQGNLYPITRAGIENLLERLIDEAESDTRYGECEVTLFEKATINDRPCTCLQVVHPKPRREFSYYKVRVFVDAELNLPVRFEKYTWPEKPGGEPPLLEEYTFLKLKFDNNFTDLDFDPKNPRYDFPD